MHVHMWSGTRHIVQRSEISSSHTVHVSSTTAMQTVS